MRSMKLTLVGIAVLFSVNSFAQSSAKFQLSTANQDVKQVSSTPLIDVEVYPGSTKTRFILITKNPHEEKVDIRVRGSMGKIYERTTRKKTMRTIFDLSQLEDDSYTLTVSCAGHKLTKALELRTTYAAAVKTLEIK
jgi:hypothetical protein